MEPVHALKRLVPVDVARLCQSDRRVGAVIDDLARKLVRAGLQKVDAHAALAAHDALRVYAEAAQLADALVTQRVLRQHRQVRRVLAEVGQRHRHIRLAAAERRFHHIALEKPLVTRRAQAQHDLTKG